MVDWSRALLDTASVRAKRGGGLTGPNPVDRGKPGSKLHVLSDRTGLPLAVGVSAANTHDSLGLQPLVRAIPAVRSRRGRRRRRPAKLHADKGYDYPQLRAWLRDRRVTPASPAAASTPRPGSAGTADASSPPSPACSATAASPPATKPPRSVLRLSHPGGGPYLLPPTRHVRHALRACLENY